jgi:hypothetical protein
MLILTLRSAVVSGATPVSTRAHFHSTYLSRNFYTAVYLLFTHSTSKSSLYTRLLVLMILIPRYQGFKGRGTIQTNKLWHWDCSRCHSYRTSRGRGTWAWIWGLKNAYSLWVVSSFSKKRKAGRTGGKKIEGAANSHRCPIKRGGVETSIQGSVLTHIGGRERQNAQSLLLPPTFHEDKSWSRPIKLIQGVVTRRASS